MSQKETLSPKERLKTECLSACVCLCSSVSSTTETVVGTYGDTLELPCNHVATPAENIMFIQWKHVSGLFHHLARFHVSGVAETCSPPGVAVPCGGRRAPGALLHAL